MYIVQTLDSVVIYKVPVSKDSLTAWIVDETFPWTDVCS